MILRGKLLADFGLVCRRLPIHIGDLIVRAQILLRVAMAIEAPLHGQRLGLKHEGHLVDLAVAGGATDTLIHVDAVIEIYEIRQPVDLYPRNRFIGAVALAHWFKISGILKQNRMAIHTGLGRGNSGLRGSFDPAVTVATVDAIVTGMMFVAELDRLIADNILACVVRRTREHQDAGESQRHRQNGE
jgi:hypothetical protein